jgi:transcriptional regulator with XRE-family HTH domain
MTQLQKEKRERENRERSEKIRSLYEESGLSYTEFANIVGCKRNTIACYLTRKRVPPKKTLKDIEKKITNYFSNGSEYIDKKSCEKLFADKVYNIILKNANEPDTLYKSIIDLYNSLPVRTTQQITKEIRQKSKEENES